MTKRILYDACMLVGYALTVAGAALTWGLGPALLSAGLGLVILNELASTH